MSIKIYIFQEKIIYCYLYESALYLNIKTSHTNRGAYLPISNIPLPCKNSLSLSYKPQLVTPLPHPMLINLNTLRKLVQFHTENIAGTLPTATSFHESYLYIDPITKFIPTAKHPLALIIAHIDN